MKQDISIPAQDLYFHSDYRSEAESLVLRYHYSRRIPSNVQFVGCFNLGGGLFGDRGECIAAAFFSIPPTRWAEPVLELSRLVRKDGLRVPLTRLISLSLNEIKRRKIADLIVSFADKTHGHEGYVYRACSWNYAGCRERRMDGLIIDGIFHPGRSCNSNWGTRSPIKLKDKYPNKSIEPHYDEGKHCYWKEVTNKGLLKAYRIKLESLPYLKEDASGRSSASAKGLATAEENETTR